MKKIIYKDSLCNFLDSAKGTIWYRVFKKKHEKPELRRFSGIIHLCSYDEDGNPVFYGHYFFKKVVYKSEEYKKKDRLFEAFVEILLVGGELQKDCKLRRGTFAHMGKIVYSLDTNDELVHYIPMRYNIEYED